MSILWICAACTAILHHVCSKLSGFFFIQHQTRESFQPPRPVFYSHVDWRAAKPSGVASEAEKRSEIKGAGVSG